MEAALKELTKLEKLTGDSSAKAKSASIFDSLDSLLDSLRAARQLCVEDILLRILAWIYRVPWKQGKRTSMNDRRRFIPRCLALGRPLEKVRVVGLIAERMLKFPKKFTGTLPSYPNLFTSEQSVAALERTVVLHFLRTGQFDTAQTF